jgi:hypothetical protein
MGRFRADDAKVFPEVQPKFVILNRVLVQPMKILCVSSPSITEHHK